MLAYVENKVLDDMIDKGGTFEEEGRSKYTLEVDDCILGVVHQLGEVVALYVWLLMIMGLR